MICYHNLYPEFGGGGGDRSPITIYTKKKGKKRKSLSCVFARLVPTPSMPLSVVKGLGIHTFPPWCLDGRAPNEVAEEMEEFLEWLEKAGSASIHWKQNETVQAYKKEFRDQKMAVFVYASNRLEQTVPLCVSPPEMYKILWELLELPEKEQKEEKVMTWPADGPTDKRPSRAQLKQHLSATKRIVDAAERKEMLSTEWIVSVYEMLMRGAKDEDHQEIDCSGWRTGSVHAGDGYEYVSPILLPKHMDDLILRFNERFRAYQEGTEDISPIYESTALFYHFVTIHPFPNGNGRMARLLLAFALMLYGVTYFPIVLSSTHSYPKARKHYMAGIKRARTHQRDPLSFLVADVVTSLQHTETNFWQHLQWKDVSFPGLNM